MDPWTDTKNDKSSDAYALLGKDEESCRLCCHELYNASHSRATSTD